MALDVEALTLGEVAFIESTSGQSIDSVGENSAPKGKLLAALATIAKRREGFPDFKFNDGLGLTMTEAMELIGFTEDEESEAEEEPDPTE